MSLINEALKKAQRQRAGAENPTRPPFPPGPAEPPPAVVRRRPAMPAQTLVLIFAGTAMLSVTAIGLGVWLWWSGMSTPSVAPPPAVATVPPRPPDTVTPPVVVELPPTVPAVVEPTPPVVAIPPTTNIPVVEPPVLDPEPEELTPPPAGLPSPRVYAYINALRVSGIRPSLTDPKVLMNERIFRVNDMIEPRLGLRLVSISQSSLVFVDSRGVKYTRSF